MVKLVNKRAFTSYYLNPQEVMSTETRFIKTLFHLLKTKYVFFVSGYALKN